MHEEAIAAFREVIQASGLEPPDVIGLDKVHRFPGIGKRNGNTAGWCILLADGLGGCFGDWSSDCSEHWQARRDRPFTLKERAAFERRIVKAKAQVKAERDVAQSKAAHKAAVIWSAASPAPDNHPYLARKRIKGHGATLYKGALVLPVTDFTGNLTSLQFIKPDGSKRLLSGGRKRGCFIRVAGDLQGASKVIICEGWATGCTLAEDDPSALVLAAIDADNLKAVAVTARGRWPDVEIIIAGDDDRQTPGNPGATKARAAAVAARALLALPQWPDGCPEHLSDYNDLASWLTGGLA